MESIVLYQFLKEKNSLSDYSSDFSGEDMTEYMKNLLNETGKFFNTSVEKEIVKTIKEKVCHVALDFEEELKYVEPFDYEMPDGSHIIIKNQRIRCPEALFKPKMFYKEEKGITEICYDSIQKCKYENRKDLYNCIILSGGTICLKICLKDLPKKLRA